MPQLLDAVRLAFQYPLLVHVRRHGPLGYLNYQSYKPWLPVRMVIPVYNLAIQRGYSRPPECRRTIFSCSHIPHSAF